MWPSQVPQAHRRARPRGRRHRRAWLATGTLCLLSTVPRWVEATDPSVRTELTGYGGTSAGTFPRGCERSTPPSASLHYGGLGGKVAVRPSHDEDEEERAWQLSLAAVGERRSYTLLKVGARGEDNVPPTRVIVGGTFQLAYDWRWVGLGFGAYLFPQMGDVESSSLCGTAGSPASTGGGCGNRAVYDRYTTGGPELHLRIGPPESFRVEGGFGSYDVATIMRPGLYMGAALRLPTGIDVSLRMGYHDVFEGTELARRYALGARIPIVSDLRLGAGAAFSDAPGGADSWEGSFTAEYTFGRER